DGLRVAASLAWRVLVVAAAIVALALALASLRLVLLPTVIALLIATVLDGPAGRLRAHGVPSGLSALIVLLAGAATLVALVALAAAFVVVDVGQFGDLRQSVNQGVDRIATTAADSPLGVSESEVQSLVDRGRQELQDRATHLAGGALTGALVLVEVATGFALTIVLLFFFLSDGRGMWEWVVRLFPDEHQSRVRAVGIRSWGVLSGYVRGTAAVALADAILIGAALLVLGIPLALPLSVFIFVGAFVPIVGAFVTGFAAVMVALASDGVLSAGAVLLAIVIVQQLEGHVLQPLLVGRSVSLHPAAVILAVTAGGTIWGIAGAFVAVPLAAVVATGVSAFGHPEDVDGSERSVAAD
ncbi:MAG: AI-2E family transporter, partial [Dehalococcoidia bacterium]